MATIGYLFFWLLAQLIAVAVGFASHYAHAFLSIPEKLVDGSGWTDHLINNSVSSGYNPFADYDEQGFWEFYSLKNFLIHAAPLSVVVFGFGCAWLPERVEKLATLCGALAKAGITPLLCP